MKDKNRDRGIAKTKLRSRFVSFLFFSLLFFFFSHSLLFLSSLSLLSLFPLFSGGGEKPSKHSFESLLSSSLSESIALAEKKQYKHPLLSLLDEAGERIKEEGKEKEKEKGEKREERTEISLGHARSPKIERKEEKEKEKERVILIEGDVVKREREVEKVTEILAVLKVDFIFILFYFRIYFIVLYFNSSFLFFF